MRGTSELAAADPDVVAGDTLLYRRVHPVHYKLKEDGSYRLRDTAFKNPTGQNDMSVQMQDTLAALGKTAGDMISSSDWGVAGLSAHVPMDEEQDVRRTPREEDPAHGDVIGDKPTGRRKRFARAAHWVVSPAE